MVTKQPILFTDHAWALGGAERSLLLLLQHLDRERFAPHLACAGGPLAEAAAAFGVPTYTVTLPRLRRSPRAPLDWLAGVRILSRLAKQIHASALIANTVRAAIYAALAARLARAPFVWHMRDLWLTESQPRHPWTDTLGKWALCTAATHVIANSNITASHLPCPCKVTVVHNGIRVEKFAPTLDGQPFRRQYGIPLDAPVVGNVGRLRPWKGQDRFLRIVARVRSTIPGTWGVVVGGSLFGVDDGYWIALQRLAERLGLGERTVFTGQLSDTLPALAALDIFVHPGDPEPFGLVNIEAMAMAKPVVAFAHGALPEIVVNGETGFLVSPGDEDALARAVVTLLHDPAQRTAMGHAGRERVLQMFNVEQTARGVEAVLDKAFSKGNSWIPRS